MRFAYGRSFTDEQVIADKGAQMYQGQVQLASMTQSLFGHMGIILRMSGEPFATLTGKVARITELDEVMQVRRTEHNWWAERPARPTCVSGVMASSVQAASAMSL